MIIPVGEGTFLKDIERRPESNKKDRAPWGFESSPSLSLFASPKCFELHYGTMAIKHWR